MRDIVKDLITADSPDAVESFLGEHLHYKKLDPQNMGVVIVLENIRKRLEALEHLPGIEPAEVITEEEKTRILQFLKDFLPDMKIEKISQILAQKQRHRTLLVISQIRTNIESVSKNALTEDVEFLLNLISDLVLNGGEIQKDVIERLQNTLKELRDELRGAEQERDLMGYQEGLVRGARDHAHDQLKIQQTAINALQAEIDDRDEKLSKLVDWKNRNESLVVSREILDRVTSTIHQQRSDIAELKRMQEDSEEKDKIQEEQISWLEKSLEDLEFVYAWQQKESSESAVAVFLMFVSLYANLATRNKEELAKNREKSFLTLQEFAYRQQLADSQKEWKMLIDCIDTQKDSSEIFLEIKGLRKVLKNATMTRILDECTQRLEKEEELNMVRYIDERIAGLKAKIRKEGYHLAEGVLQIREREGIQKVWENYFKGDWNNKFEAQLGRFLDDIQYELDQEIARATAQNASDIANSLQLI